MNLHTRWSTVVSRSVYPVMSLRAIAFALPSVVALILALGCANPQQRLDDFGNRVVDAAVIVHPDSMPLSTIPDVTGTFLMSIHIAFITDPVQLIATVTFTPSPGGGGTLDFTGQLLSYPDRATLVGDPVVLNGNSVSTGGDFTLTKMGLMIPAAANPAGVDAVADTTIALSILSTDDFCGIVSGMVTSPFSEPLDGSTSGAIRITAGTMGTALPAASMPGDR